MIGNIPPFFITYGPASATQPGILTASGQSIGGRKAFPDGISFPTFDVTGATTATALTETIQGTTDTGTNALHVRNYRIGASTATATRPIWQDQNNGVAVLSLLPINSGADSALLFRANGLSIPSFTTRGAGTRLILAGAIDGSNVDYAIGVNTSTLWYSVAQASSGFSHRWYAGNTSRMQLLGDGTLITTGLHRRAYRIALTSPVTVANGTDDIVEINLTTPGAVAINLPSVTAGAEIVLIDGKGDAGANNHTITPASGNINGAGTKVYATNYYRATLANNGTQWLAG